MQEWVLALILLISQVTGIQREVDPGLTAIAEQRAVEVQSDWSHNQARPGTLEVLQRNNVQILGQDPLAHAVQAWRDSPDHWNYLSNPELTRIGCAISQDSIQIYYFVCVLAAPVVIQEPELLTEPVPAPEPEILVPDTAYTP